MKKKFSKILGVGLTLALLCSLLLTAAPVSALSSATVTVDPATISAVDAEYSIFFTVNEELDGDDSEDVLLPDASATAQDAFTITGVATAESGTITVTSGSVDVTLANAATIDGAALPITITPGDGAVAWTTAAAIDVLTVTATLGSPDTAVTWMTELGTGASAAVEADDDITGTGGAGAPDAFTMPDVGDTIRFTAAAATDTVTLVLTTGTIAVPVFSGLGTYTAATGVIAFAAIGETCDITAATPVTAATWARTVGLATSAVPALGEVDELVTLSGLAADGDSITITFPDDTELSVAVPTATITGTSGWVGITNTPANLTNGVIYWTHDVDDLTLTYTMRGGDVLGSSAQVMINITAGITNPTEPDDDYSLEIETSEEDAVESEEYEIEVPDVDVLPGIVQAYNPAGILMDSDTGAGAIQTMLNIADEGWVIKIGEGEYTENPNTACADITIEGSGDLEDIIIVGNWTIDEIDVTLDNLTLDGDIVVSADDFIIQDCAVDDGGTLDINAGGTDAAVTDTTFDVEDDVGIAVDEDDTVITGCTFDILEDGVGISVEDGGIDTNVSDSTFTGSSGVGINVTNAASVLDVEDSTFDGLATALDIDAGTVGITGSTIEDCAAEAVIVTLATSVILSGNTITGNDAAALLQVAADAENVHVLFNTIINNAGDDDGLLIDNNDTDVDLIVANNWWGDVAGPGDDAFSDDVVSEPFLAGAVSVTAGIDANVAIATIADFEDTVGVTVVAAGAAMDVVAASQYLVNPVAAIANAVGFWDVYVIGGAALDDVEIRIYTDVTEDTEVWVWGEARGEWLEATSYTPNLFSGFILVEVDATSGIPMVDDLGALPFAVIEPAADEDELDAPATINAPVSGAVDVSLTPTFAWAAVDDADGYYFELADNANFVLPLVKLDGDMGRLIVTAYAYVGELPYSTAYYWRVRAVSGTAEAGDLVESDWVSAVFITKAEPEEVIPPIVIEEAPILPDITITQPDIIIESPDIIVPLPDVVETPITPSWIYVIIGVGAVLVIALLVLIVRTRRVA